MNKQISVNIPRFMIVGTGSGSGKTTLTCAVLKALQNQKLRLAAFKCGPDYIDPMFHSKVIGTQSRNLDIYLSGEKAVKHLFGENSRGADLAVIEGVMGMYDGLNSTEKCSSNHLATLLKVPQVLVVNAKGKSLSILAEISGFLNFMPNNIKGIILNQTTAGMFPVFKGMIEKAFDLCVYGYLPVVQAATFQSRHLGLITANEIEDIQVKLSVLAETAEKTIDLDGLVQLAKAHSGYDYERIGVQNICGEKPVKLAVAYDRAFNFYYEDNFELFKLLGAHIEFFSPMHDQALPEGINGVIFGGGYPEENAAVLSANKPMLNSVKAAILGGLPVIAECGGFMYLCKTLMNKNGKRFDMVGAIDAEGVMTNRLARFGYAMATAEHDNMLCKQGERIAVHEFHHSDTNNNGQSFITEKASGSCFACVHASETMVAGYPHMHLWGGVSFAENFVKKCLEVG